jgi:hypothetical protein
LSSNVEVIMFVSSAFRLAVMDGFLASSVEHPVAGGTSTGNRHDATGAWPGIICA